MISMRSPSRTISLPNVARRTTRSFFATAMPRSGVCKCASKPSIVSPSGNSRTSPLTVAFITSPLHVGVDRALPALRGNPSDDLIGVHNVAGLAMYTVGEVDLQPPFDLAVLLFKKRLVDLRRTEILTRIAVFHRAAVAANVEVSNFEMARLILFVRHAAVVNVGEFSE